MNKSPKLTLKLIYILFVVVFVFAIAFGAVLIHNANEKLREEITNETMNRVLVELNYFEEEIRSSIPKELPQIPDPTPEPEEIPEIPEPDPEPIEEDIPDEVIEPDPIPKSAPEPETTPADTTTVVTNELIDSYIYEICENYYPNIDPYIIQAQVYTESRYRTDAYNPNGGSIGLMQIIPRWHGDRIERLGVTDLYDAYQNLMVGIDYMNELYEMKNDIAYALMAFNMGPSSASSSYNSGNISWYASTIMERADALRGDSNA